MFCPLQHSNVSLVDGPVLRDYDCCRQDPEYSHWHSSVLRLLTFAGGLCRDCQARTLTKWMLTGVVKTILVPLASTGPTLT